MESYIFRPRGRVASSPSLDGDSSSSDPSEAPSLRDEGRAETMA